jgi:hypothetical protein
MSPLVSSAFTTRDCVTDEPEDTRPEDEILRDGEEMLNSGEYERLIRMAQNTVAGQVRLAAAVTGPLAEGRPGLGEELRLLVFDDATRPGLGRDLSCTTCLHR